MKTCSAQRPVSRDDEPLAVDKPGTLVVFTYDVLWQKSEVAWANRWEAYLKTGNDDDIHWFSIMNSLMIVLFMTGMIAMILVRSLYRDIARYNEETSPEEAAEETGWKLVHGDVFRPPSGFFGPMFLSVFVGGGMQVLAMCVCLLVFAVLGFLSPAQQGNLVTAFVLLFVFMGSFAGYFSARLYKMFKGQAWKRNTFLTVRRAAWRARALAVPVRAAHALTALRAAAPLLLPPPPPTGLRLQRLAADHRGRRQRLRLVQEELAGLPLLERAAAARPLAARLRAARGRRLLLRLQG